MRFSAIGNWQAGISILQFALLTAASIPVQAAVPLRAGVAVVNITPPIPFRMSGYFMERLSTGTKDPLRVKAIVFEQGEESAALVFCDLVGVPRDITAKARQQASAATGIPVQHIAISATHTHTGPLYFNALHDFFHERRLTRTGNDPHDSTEYRAQLVDRIASAIIEANASLRRVELKASVAHEPTLPFNRRFHMKDGTVRFNPGQLNPDIVRPAGPVDPEVGIVMLVEPDASQPLTAIVAFAMHLDTVSGTEYSADYPKYTEDRLRETFGDDFMLLFAAGTCGDINDIDVTKSGRRGAKALGRTLGDAVAAAVKSSHFLSHAEPALAVRSVEVQVPLQKYSAEEIAEARNKLELIGTRDLSFGGQVEAYKIVDVQRLKDPWPLEVQVFRLNRETAIVTLPSEIFVELGLAIKAASPFKTTLVVELTNDAIGYIPTRKAFVEGSYETINSRIEPGGGERLVEAAIGLLKELE
jgi:neutral ceramidase